MKAQQPDKYAERVRELEGEGLSTSDAQGVADAEIAAAAPGPVHFVQSRDEAHCYYVEVDYATHAGNPATWTRYASAPGLDAASNAAMDKVKGFKRCARVYRCTVQDHGPRPLQSIMSGDC